MSIMKKCGKIASWLMIGILSIGLFHDVVPPIHHHQDHDHSGNEIRQDHHHHHHLDHDHEEENHHCEHSLLCFLIQHHSHVDHSHHYYPATVKRSHEVKQNDTKSYGSIGKYSLVLPEIDDGDTKFVSGCHHMIDDPPIVFASLRGPPFIA